MPTTHKTSLANPPALHQLKHAEKSFLETTYGPCPSRINAEAEAVGCLTHGRESQTGLGFQGIPADSSNSPAAASAHQDECDGCGKWVAESALAPFATRGGELLMCGSCCQAWEGAL